LHAHARYAPTASPCAPYTGTGEWAKARELSGKAEGQYCLRAVSIVHSLGHEAPPLVPLVA